MVNVADLAGRSVPVEPTDAGLYTSIRGPFVAELAVISRYALAAQSQDGKPIDGPEAGLRATCLSGAIAAGLAEHGIQVTSTDLDEAVSSLLTDGFAAQDVNGVAVPSGFSRVESFRLGVEHGAQACDKRYA